MVRFLFRRLLQLALVLFLVASLAFSIVRLIPGDPIRARLGKHINPATYAAQRRALGLDRSLGEQYVEFLRATFIDLDFGTSLVHDRPVGEDLARCFPATMELTLAAMLLAVIVGVAAGVVSAVWKNSIADYASMVGALLGVSVPVYFLGILLILAFGDSLPYAHRLDMTLEFEGLTGFLVFDSIVAGRWDILADALRHLLLPAVALSTIPMAITARMTRSAMLEVLREDYVRTARAKGVRPLRVIVKHALKNAALPTVTVVGLSFGYLLAGAILTETIFSWPGMGTYIIRSFEKRDYPALQAGILVICVSFVFVNTLVDVLYAFLDPRIRYGGDVVVGETFVDRWRGLGRRLRGRLAGALPAAWRSLVALPGVLAITAAEGLRALARLPGGMRRFARSRTALVGLAIVLFFVVLAIGAPWFADHEPDAFPANGAQPASLYPGLTGEGAIEPDPETYLLGTDHLGRDLFSKVAHGARISLAIGLIAVAVSLFLGVPLGLVSGYYGGAIDASIMRIVDAMLAFPSIVLVVALFTVFEPYLAEQRINPMLFLMIAVGVVGIPRFTRQVRASVLQVKELDYVVAARALGFDDVRILLRVVLPNVLGPVIVLATLGLGTAILEAAGFTFLGIGAQPDAAEWGTMLSDTRDSIRRYPWVPIAPGVAITLAVLGFNLLGDGLRDVLDPKLR